MIKIALIMVLASLTGCAVFTSPRENPLLTKSFDATDQKASFALAATDANRRLAILDIGSGHICVEPPPEAANTISEAFNALLKADVQNKVNVNGSLSQSISQNISQLFRRTQTVQLYRDATFALCQSAINGTILIDDTTKASAPVDMREKIVNQLNQLKNKQQYSEQILDLSNKGVFGLKTLDALTLRKNELIANKQEKEAKEITEIETTLSADLKKAEFKRRLEDGLREAFVSLKQEIPIFYETEKLRFLVELSKPIQVCKTVTTYEPKTGSTESTKTETVTCELKLPENVDKVVNEYVKALSNNSGTKTADDKGTSPK